MDQTKSDHIDFKLAFLNFFACNTVIMMVIMFANELFFQAWFTLCFSTSIFMTTLISTHMDIEVYDYNILGL